MPGRMPRTSPHAERSLVRLIARRLKALRFEREMSLDDVAGRTRGKIARSTIGNYESYAAFPSIPTLFAIGKALRVHAAELILDPQRPREAAAIAVLRADDETVAVVAAKLGIK